MGKILNAVVGVWGHFGGPGDPEWSVDKMSSFKSI